MRGASRASLRAAKERLAAALNGLGRTALHGSTIDISHQNFGRFSLYGRPRSPVIPAGCEPVDGALSRRNRGGLGGENLAGLSILSHGIAAIDLGRKVAEVKRRQVTERKVEERDPGR